ncbi:MAG TPA: sulfurtransferase TusA family protein [Mycobacteriales bacterium]|nr:sulfurtransferase TusA family protein [Mycobacteriales bacterium]
MTSPAGPSAEPVVLDCRGRRCPLPVIELARRIGSVPVGGSVVVVADDPAARLDIPAWCRMRGQEYLGEDAAPDGVPSYQVRRLR